MLQAKGVATGMTEVFVENFLINDFAKLYSRRAACRAANQSCKNSACDAAEGYAERAAYETGSSSRFGSRHDHGAGCARKCSDGATKLARTVAGFNVQGMALGTNRKWPFVLVRMGCRDERSLPLRRHRGERDKATSAVSPFRARCRRLRRSIAHSAPARKKRVKTARYSKGEGIGLMGAS